MNRSLFGLGALLGALGTASPAWAHPTTGLHVHPGEITGLLVVTLIVVGMLVLAWKKQR